MTERFTSDLFFILVALLVAALLGIIIGYLFGKRKHAKCVDLENEIDELKSKLHNCLKDKEKHGMVYDAEAVRKVFMKKIRENDLKIVEGIGEKIEGLLKNKGIDTWYKLSQASDDELKSILLTDGGPSYAIHEPKTWPTQALFAYEGKWEALKEYQDKLTGGR